MRCNLFLASLAALLACASASSAAMFSENFDVDPTASWTVNDPGLSDIIADFYYDYSAIGVPAAPGGVTTRGLKMTANNSGGVFSGFSVSPNGQSFSGNYKVSFDMWQNYVGPLGPGGSGTTHDWNISRRIVSSSKVPVILAGGLSPSNVAVAIRAVRPYAVDVASGVEGKDRVKDIELVRSFVRNARAELNGSEYK